jgi:hypothetical protein
LCLLLSSNVPDAPTENWLAVAQLVRTRSVAQVRARWGKIHALEQQGVGMGGDFATSTAGAVVKTPTSGGMAKEKTSTGQPKEKRRSVRPVRKMGKPLMIDGRLAPLANKAEVSAFVAQRNLSRQSAVVGVDMNHSSLSNWLNGTIKTEAHAIRIAQEMHKFMGMTLDFEQWYEERLRTQTQAGAEGAGAGAGGGKSPRDGQVQRMPGLPLLSPASLQSLQAFVNGGGGRCHLCLGALQERKICDQCKTDWSQGKAVMLVAQTLPSGAAGAH